jgi:hypothetical protein
MASKVVYLAVTVKGKDEGRLPRFGEVAVNLQDALRDLTKHDMELPWQVTSVTEVSIPGAGVQFGDLNEQNNVFKTG